jgi:Tol biopolymer transport system component
MSTRATVGDAWEAPVPVAELNTLSNETTVMVAGDGLSIHFGSDRVIGSDIYLATRDARTDPWGMPAVVAELSTGVAEYGGYVSNGGLRIVFCREITPVDTDIFAADRADPGATWNPPTVLASLMTGSSECECMEPDAQTIYFGSERGGNFDIFTATRPQSGGGYSNITPVVELNTPDADGDPWVAPDQRTIVFASQRGGNADLYTSTR